MIFYFLRFIYNIYIALRKWAIRKSVNKNKKIKRRIKIERKRRIRRKRKKIEVCLNPAKVNPVVNHPKAPHLFRNVKRNRKKLKKKIRNIKNRLPKNKHLHPQTFHMILTQCQPLCQALKIFQRSLLLCLWLNHQYQSLNLVQNNLTFLNFCLNCPMEQYFLQKQYILVITWVKELLTKY